MLSWWVPKETEVVRVLLLSQALQGTPLACRGKGRALGCSAGSHTGVHCPEGASEPEGTNLLEVGVLTGAISFVTHCHHSLPV